MSFESLRSRALGKYVGESSTTKPEEELPLPLGELKITVEQCLEEYDKFACFIKLGMYSKAKEYISYPDEQLIYDIYTGKLTKIDERDKEGEENLWIAIAWETRNKIINLILKYPYNEELANKFDLDLFSFMMKMKRYDLAKQFISNKTDREYYEVVVNRRLLNIEDMNPEEIDEKIAGFLLWAFANNIKDAFRIYDLDEFIHREIMTTEFGEEEGVGEYEVRDDEAVIELLEGMLYNINDDNYYIFKEFIFIFEDMGRMNKINLSIPFREAIDSNQYQTFKNLLQDIKIYHEREWEFIIKEIIMEKRYDFLDLVKKYSSYKLKPLSYYEEQIHRNEEE